jgi:hypothetical protein
MSVIRMSAEEVERVLTSRGFRDKPIAKGSFLVLPDGSVEAQIACCDDGPEDGYIDIASITIFCDLPKGHVGGHRGHDFRNNPVYWTKKGQRMEITNR